MRSPRSALAVTLALGVVATLGCGGDNNRDTLVVFNAGSLARPLRAALDTFAVREQVIVQQESAGSLETARKLTELGNIPDVIALADAEVFPGYLMPEHVESYVTFARNRMVLAYTDRSRYASEITGANWWQIVQRAGVEVGRSDPQLDPNGYRTLMVWQLAERHYAQRALFAALEAHAPPRNVRSKEADLVGLLQAGELDYIWSYESMARASGLRWVEFPVEIDLSSPLHAAQYRQARVTVRGATAGTAKAFLGAPIVYAFAVPREAPNPAVAARFAAFLLSDAGREILRREGLDALDAPILSGPATAWFSSTP